MEFISDLTTDLGLLIAFLGLSGIFIGMLLAIPYSIGMICVRHKNNEKEYRDNIDKLKLEEWEYYKKLSEEKKE